MEYSPFNPVVWMCFLAGLALIFLGVRIYRRVHPNFPDNSETAFLLKDIAPSVEEPGYASKNRCLSKARP